MRKAVMAGSAEDLGRRRGLNMGVVCVGAAGVAVGGLADRSPKGFADILDRVAIAHGCGVPLPRPASRFGLNLQGDWFYGWLRRSAAKRFRQCCIWSC